MLIIKDKWEKFAVRVLKQGIVDLKIDGLKYSRIFIEFLIQVLIPRSILSPSANTINACS